ncbi:MAG: hypothetical protein JJE52_03205, partial [Acidimicrobiia bacterium]|nr:hypothetical protein [Acidimicrobiia bacterium]
MQTHVVDHPLAAERLARLRDETTPSAQFRQALRELSSFLVYEATRSLAYDDTTVRTPLADAPARRLSRQPAIVPVLRAGLRVVFNRWRQWDWIAAQRVDRYV